MTKILALHDSHSASICEIENNKIIYFQEAERLNRKRKSGDWLILLINIKIKVLIQLFLLLRLGMIKEKTLNIF